MSSVAMPGPSQSRRFDTSLLLACAALVIVNSHLEAYYPRSWMAADGLLGNSMFFLLSGFGVQSSLLTRPQPFVGYFTRRLRRIYPAVILVVLAIWGFAGLPSMIKDAARQLFWPTGYTYVQFIVPIYAALYFIGRRATLKRYAVTLAIFTAFYASTAIWVVAHQDLSGPLHLGSLSQLNAWAYYPLTTFIGGALAVIAPRYLATRTQLVAFVILLPLSIGIYVFAKLQMVVYGRGSEWFCLLHLLTWSICVIAFIVGTHPIIIGCLRRIPAAKQIVAALAALTLEIYLIHQAILGWNPIASVRFPLNILALLAATLLLAIPLHWLTVTRWNKKGLNEAPEAAR